MENLVLVIIWIGLFVGCIVVIRLFGSWMLRINDVIDELQKLNKKVDKLNNSMDTANQRILRAKGFI